MIGLYENFPKVHHGVAHFSTAVPTQDLQKTLLEFLQRLNENKESINLAEFTRHEIRVELEVGVADGLDFDYLNEEVLERCLKEISRTALPVLDLFYVARYYASDGAKWKPLKFDYHFVRFLFKEHEVEMLVHHERGPQHLAIEELIKFNVNRVNRELKAREMSPLEQTFIRTV